MCNAVATANGHSRAVLCSIREYKWRQMKASQKSLWIRSRRAAQERIVWGIKLTSTASFSPPSSSFLSVADLFHDSNPDVTRISWNKCDRSQAWVRALKPTRVLLTAASGAPNEAVETAPLWGLLWCNVEGTQLILPHSNTAKTGTIKYLNIVQPMSLFSSI